MKRHLHFQSSSSSKRVGQHERGAVMVEMAMSVGVFLFFLISLFDLARIGYVIGAVQYTLAKASEEVSYRILNDNLNLLDRVNSIGSKYGIRIASDELKYCPLSDTNFSCAPNYSTGEDNKSFVARIDKQVPVIGGMFDVTVSRTIIVRNAAPVSLDNTRL